jgi:flagellar basal body-associated protein FliL
VGTALTIFLVVLLCVFILPVVIYLAVKFGAAGYFAAKQRHRERAKKQHQKSYE